MESWQATGAALLVLALSLTSACGEAGAGSDLSQAQLVQRIAGEDPPLLLDVRTPEEYAGGHIPGALNIPHTEIGARLSEIRAMQPSEIVVYCERGGRAAKARALLREADFEAVSGLEGDMRAWREQGLPCVGC